MVFLQETNVQNKRKNFIWIFLKKVKPGNMDLQPYPWSCYLLLGVFTCAETAFCHNGSFVLAHNSPLGAVDLLMVNFFSWGKKRALVLSVLNWFEIPRSKYMLSNTSCTYLLKQLSPSKCLFHHSYRLFFMRGIWPLAPQKGKAPFHIAFQTTPFPGN